MSVPIDRLYNFIEDIAEDTYGDSIIIYRFYPHGSRKLQDLKWLKSYDFDWKRLKLTPELFCNDQEPLNFDLYENVSQELIDQLRYEQFYKDIQAHGIQIPRKNFRVKTMSIWDSALLLHSEKRSNEIEKYQRCDFIPVYYWSHAIIARDWYRYAQHVQKQKHTNKTFLIYSRGWTGTREYRLKFLESLIRANLHDQCQISIQPQDPHTGQHYQQHSFSNPDWQCHTRLEHYFATKQNLSSDLSADFDLDDYLTTEIEIVLETLFDDSRLHLTEKILRPIALGQPFLLAATHGSLAYLRDYGFKTFSSVWSEDYDQQKNPQQRLNMLIDVMKTIAGWTADERKKYLEQANQIAKFNKERFFSRDFFEQVVGELKTNLGLAFESLEKNNTCNEYLDLRNQMYANKQLWDSFSQMRSQQDADQVHEIVLKYHSRQQTI